MDQPHAARPGQFDEPGAGSNAYGALSFTPAQLALLERIEWNLTNHRPTDEAITRIERIRKAAVAFSRELVGCWDEPPADVPLLDERYRALEALEACVFLAVAAIARNNPAPA